MEKPSMSIFYFIRTNIGIGEWHQKCKMREKGECEIVFACFCLTSQFVDIHSPIKGGGGAHFKPHTKVPKMERRRKKAEGWHAYFRVQKGRRIVTRGLLGVSAGKGASSFGQNYRLSHRQNWHKKGFS
jgi:hypothetical protein